MCRIIWTQCSTLHLRIKKNITSTYQRGVLQSKHSRNSYIRVRQRAPNSNNIFVQGQRAIRHRLEQGLCNKSFRRYS